MSRHPEEYDSVPTLAPDHHHTVDWARVRATIKRLHLVRLGVAAAIAWPCMGVWADHVATPLAVKSSPDTAFAAGVAVTLACLPFLRAGRVRRAIAALVLVSVIGGTLAADETRALISAWIVGA